MNTQPEVVKSKSPWGKVTNNTDLYSLTDVMSEQLAFDLQSKEPDATLYPQLISNKPESSEAIANELPKFASNSVDDDYIIAQLLQLEVDKEYDDYLKRKEEVINRNSSGKNI